MIRIPVRQVPVGVDPVLAEYLISVIVELSGALENADEKIQELEQRIAALENK